MANALRELQTPEHYLGEYGFIYLAEVLRTLSKKLSKFSNVQISTGVKVSRIQNSPARVHLSNSEIISCGHVVLCAGFGMKSILGNGSLDPAVHHCSFKLMRSYVLYCELVGDSTSPEFPCPSWVALGDMDLWGMPCGEGLDWKFGCGEATHEVETPNANFCRQEIVTIFHSHYLSFFGFPLNMNTRAQR